MDRMKDNLPLCEKWEFPTFGPRTYYVVIPSEAEGEVEGPVPAALDVDFDLIRLRR
jgi:hypothetical protein